MVYHIVKHLAEKEKVMVIGKSITETKIESWAAGKRYRDGWYFNGEGI